MNTYKITLTVVEPVELVGFMEAETEEALKADLMPKLIERWGEENVSVDEIVLASEEEIEFMEFATNENKVLN